MAWSSPSHKGGIGWGSKPPPTPHQPDGGFDVVGGSNAPPRRVPTPAADTEETNKGD